MKYNILLFTVFTFVTQLLYGQEKYTIRGEFPDHSLDNEYILLYKQSALLGESKRLKEAFIDSILVVDKEFYYEGTINRKPFLASISCSKGNRFRYNTTFVVEPGDIQLRIVDWNSEGNVAGTPINDSYNLYVIERGKVVNKMRFGGTERGETTNYTKEDKSASIVDAYKYAQEGKILFLEKYAQYPDVVRYWLAMCIDPINPVVRESYLSRFLHIVDLMPKVDRDILLAWRDYRVKLKEYLEKVAALKDCLDVNKPRFIEVISNDSFINNGK